jgi:CBS domain-containing protein
MVWYKKDYNKNIPKLPEIEEVSKEIPAISEFLEAFRLPEAFRQAETDTLPVLNMSGEVTGIVSEFDLAKILPDWSFKEDGYTRNVAVSEIMTKKVWTEPEHTNIKELLDSIPSMHTRVIPITKPDGKYTGNCITRTALIEYLTSRVKPRSLGGLATPLGVYLTDGIHQAGAKTQGLFLTGAVFALSIIFIRFISEITVFYFFVPEFFSGVIEMILFLVFIRFSPFAKIHAAEHKTINAIETGMPLTVETVKLQSRVHRRCGTNFMVFILGILTVVYLSRILIPEENVFLKFIFILTGFLFVMSYWKNVGGLLQKYFTTAPPDEKHIKNGIKAGEELLKIHREDTRNNPPGFFEKLWNMGIVQIFTSFMLTTWLFNYFVSKILGIPL